MLLTIILIVLDEHFDGVGNEQRFVNLLFARCCVQRVKRAPTNLCRKSTYQIVENLFVAYRHRMGMAKLLDQRFKPFLGGFVG